MFKIFQRGKIATRMAKIFLALNSCIEERLTNAKTVDDVSGQVYLIIYSLKRGVVEKADRYDVPVSFKLYIPKMGWITIAEAMTQIMVKLSPFIQGYGLEDDVEEIMSNGRLYYQIENSLPLDQWSHLEY